MNFDEEPEGDPHGECTDEIHKLQAEVELSHKSLKVFRDSLNNVAKQRDAAKEIAESAKLQVGVLRGKMGHIRNLLCAPGPGIETPIKNIDAAWRIAVASSGAVGASEKQETNNSCKQQTEKDWWGWGWKELSGKTPEQLEVQAKKVAATYKWSLPKERVIELLLSGKR